MIQPFWLAPGDYCLGASIIPAVYYDLPEIRESGALEDVARRILEATEGNSRCELLAVLDGQLIGFACVVEEEDMHVGRCLTLQWQYVVPEHRGKIGGEFLRWLVKTGRKLGFAFVAYSHRVNNRHYAIKYRRVNHGQEVKENNR
jgi:GNAT superfamily N-acetyltransferase